MQDKYGVLRSRLLDRAIDESNVSGLGHSKVEVTMILNIKNPLVCQGCDGQGRIYVCGEIEMEPCPICNKPNKEIVVVEPSNVKKDVAATSKVKAECKNPLSSVTVPVVKKRGRPKRV